LELDYSHKDPFIFSTRDNGIGASDMSAGFGIIGIKERVLLLGGMVDVTNKPGAGFIVKISLPVKK
jgi:signal transduction histidine kinase